MRYPVLVLVLTLAAPRAQAQTDYSLADCFRLAVARSEVLAQDVESIRQAEEGIRQTRANFLPTVSLNATLVRQQTPSNALGQNLFPSKQDTAQFTGTQSLFKGLQDLATLRQKKALKRASAQAWRQAYLQLYQDTAQAYFSVLEDDHDLRNYARELAAQQARRQQLAGMRRLGRARETDVVSIDASIQSVEAAIASSRGILGADRETLSFLTGLGADVALIDVDSAPALSGRPADWLARIDARPDVEEAREKWQASEHAVSGAKGEHLPTANLTGNYYLTRPGAYSGVNWDAQLTLSLPIFSGGGDQSRVRQAVSARASERTAYDLARRKAGEAIGSAYRTVSFKIEQSGRLAEATRLYDRYYDLLLKDNQAGIATNVDVLLALATAEQTRRQFDRTRLSAHYEHIRLRIASADAEILALASGGNNAAAE